MADRVGASGTSATLALELKKILVQVVKVHGQMHGNETDLRTDLNVHEQQYEYIHRIDFFQEGVAIILRVMHDDPWLVNAVANTYSRLTLGCLASIVRDFLTCQSIVVSTSIPIGLLKEGTRIFLVSGEAELVDASV